MIKFCQGKGFTLVEVIFAVTIMTLMFSGVFGTVQLVLNMIGKSKAHTGALSLANERMEYIRSLPYNQVGTIGSPPYGSIPQNSTTTLNGFTYSERVLITYVDDEADGSGGADANAIMEDYKQVKIEYSWDNRGRAESMYLISNIIPVGVETTVGGGTIRVNVFDDSALPVQGAEVHLVNGTLSTTTDTVRYTNNAGVALLSGAPEGGNYEIGVTKTDFSWDGTYTSSSSNPNPVTPPVAVVESAVSTMNFQIATTSDLTVNTWNQPTIVYWNDDLSNASKVATSASSTVSGGWLELEETTPGVYAGSGFAISTTTAPASIDSWYDASFSATTSASTSVSVSIYYASTSGLELVPDSDLSGNSAGFGSSPINVSGLDPVDYPELAIGVNLNTTDSSYTSGIDEWEISYISSRTGLANIDFNLRGQKTIGTDASLQPVYKYNKNLSTDGSGELDLADMEWDIYDISLITGGYSIVESCKPLPYSLSPGVNETLDLTLAPSVAYALRVSVTEIDGTPIHGATVNLERGAIDVTEDSSLCGQVYFDSGLVSASDYTLTVSKSGYTTYVDSATSIISSTSTVAVTLN